MQAETHICNSPNELLCDDYYCVSCLFHKLCYFFFVISMCKIDCIELLDGEKHSYSHKFKKKKTVKNAILSSQCCQMATKIISVYKHNFNENLAQSC